MLLHGQLGSRALRNIVAIPIGVAIALLVGSPAAGQLGSILGAPKKTSTPVAVPPSQTQQPGTATLPAPQSSAGFELQPYEWLGPFANGCSMLMTTGDPPSYGLYSWYGACRAGLADGPGFLVYKDPNIANGIQRVSMKLGRIESVSGVTSNLISIPRGPGRNFSETLSTEDMPVRQAWEKPGEFVTDRNGKSAPHILTRHVVTDDTKSVRDDIWLVKAACPTFGSGAMDKALAGDYYGGKLDAVLRSKLLGMCSKALARAKGEGLVDRDGFSPGTLDPYASVDYGYFFMVYHERTENTRKGEEMGFYSGPSTTQVVASALCPDPVSLTGCETVWQAMQAPFSEKRNSLMAIAKTAEADALADRELRASGSRERIANLIARLTTEKPDYQPVPAPKVSLPKTGGKTTP